MKSFEQIARAMHAAYLQELLTTIGENGPTWECLFKAEKSGWIAAARAAHQEITEVQ